MKVKIIVVLAVVIAAVILMARVMGRDSITHGFSKTAIHRAAQSPLWNTRWTDDEKRRFIAAYDAEERARR